MKIKNEYIQVKIGDKTYTKQNMIFNKYLNKIFNMQIYTDFQKLGINFCYLKLDTPIENVNYDSDLNGMDDFDVLIWSEFNPSIITNNNYAKITYNFGNSRVQYKTSSGVFEQTYDLNVVAGRKITGIGFGIGYDCMAYLDTSNMNMIINYNEKITITRVDTISSDGVIKGLEYPLHLVNNIVSYEIKPLTPEIHDTLYKKAQLYSVGFGNKIGLMEEEYLIEDLDTTIDETSITFELNRIKKLGHYPSEDLHFTFYPTMDNSKYIIFKYRLFWQSGNTHDISSYTNEYYTMSKPNENFGNLGIKLKIERQ